MYSTVMYSTLWLFLTLSRADLNQDFDELLFARGLAGSNGAFAKHRSKTNR